MVAEVDAQGDGGQQVGVRRGGLLQEEEEQEGGSGEEEGLGEEG